MAFHAPFADAARDSLKEILKHAPRHEARTEGLRQNGTHIAQQVGRRFLGLWVREQHGAAGEPQQDVE